MSLRINTNIDALNAYRNLSVTQGQMSKSLERLSSGYRINRAADDAAGLAISEGLKSQIGGLKVAVRNTQDAINVVQTADGALTETHSILQRMRDLAVQSANDSNDQTSRDAINAEATQLKAELDRISDKTTFNNVNLLDGSFKDKQFQVGYAAGDTIAVDIQADKKTAATATLGTAGGGDFSSTALTFDLTVDGTTKSVSLSGNYADANELVNALNQDANAGIATWSVDGSGKLVATSKSTGTDSTVTIANTAGAGTSGVADQAVVTGTDTKVGFSSTDLGVNSVNLGSQAGAEAAITTIDNAIEAVSTSRANLGAFQNRFEHTINNLNVAVENLTASRSSITDTDMASEMMSFTRAQILSQAGTAMLAQANQAPQSVLQLLRG